MPGSIKPLKIRAYLRMRATGCTCTSGPRGMLVRVADVEGLFPDGLTAQWIGTEAEAFLAAHVAELVPGRCLDLEISHLRPVKGDLRARIESCQLAPKAPSQIKHEQTTSSTEKAI